MRLLILRPLCILPTTCPLSSPHSIFHDKSNSKPEQRYTIQDLSKGFIESEC